MKSVQFLEPAEAEIEEAVQYFDEQRPSLGDRFEQELLSVVRFIAEHPHAGKKLTPTIRSFGLRAFRYNVIYAVEDTVTIVAVAHHRRRPGYWRGRLR